MMVGKRLLGWVLGAALAMSVGVRGDIVVTLDPAGDTTRVPAGSRVAVDILLSVDGDDAPMLEDVRLIAFDLSETDPGIVLDAPLALFVWDLGLSGGDGLYIVFETVLRPSATYTGLMGIDGFILTLTETPRRVASIDVTVADSGTLDLVSGTGSVFNAGFEMPTDYSVALGTVRGGRLAFRAEQPDGVDTDGDSIPDAVDDFPSDPDETDDTDNDNIGNMADPDDDGDMIADNVDPFPLGGSEGQGNDNSSGGNQNGNANANANANDNEAPTGNANSNTGGDDNDNGSAMGPRVTGGLCAMGMLNAGMLIALGLAFTRLGRRFARGPDRLPERGSTPPASRVR